MNLYPTIDNYGLGFLDKSRIKPKMRDPGIPNNHNGIKKSTNHKTVAPRPKRIFIRKLYRFEV